MREIVAAAKERNETTTPAVRYVPTEIYKQEKKDLEYCYYSSSDNDDDRLTAEGYVEAFVENRCPHEASTTTNGYRNCHHRQVSGLIQNTTAGPLESRGQKKR